MALSPSISEESTPATGCFVCVEFIRSPGVSDRLRLQAIPRYDHPVRSRQGHSFTSVAFGAALFTGQSFLDSYLTEGKDYRTCGEDAGYEGSESPPGSSPNSA
jgi:hypothetical protein